MHNKTHQMIEVNIDSTITRNMYFIAIEALLKFILYHYNQIPMLYDILEKEITNAVILSSQFSSTMKNISNPDIEGLSDRRIMITKRVSYFYDCFLKLLV